MPAKNTSAIAPHSQETGVRALAIVLLCWPVPGFAAAASPVAGSAWVLLALAVTLLLVLAWHVRKVETLRKQLYEVQRSLASRVEERTFRLRQINTRLYAAITEHEVTRKQLQESEAYTESILESMPSLVIGVDPELNITHWNRAAEHLCGLSQQQAIGKPLLDCYPELPFQIELISSAIAERRVRTIDPIHRRENQVDEYLSAVVYPLTSGGMNGAVLRIDDITRRVGLERMLVQDEKLLSMGRMAAGLAHEINNPIAALVQSSQTIERRLLDSLPANQAEAEALGLDFAKLQAYCEARDIPQLLQHIKEAGERTTNIVKTMLDFSHSSQMEHAAFDVRAMLDNSITIARQEFPAAMRESIMINVHDDASQVQSRQALGAVNEVQQVVINLLTNACDALAEYSSSAPAGFTPQIDIHSSFGDALVNIDIADNGPGIPDALRQQIFEPFFTTKGVGVGTGLGLAVSYFIMTEHHLGSLDLLDNDDQPGTTFRISLPVAEAA